jgi:hypothetical protein
MSKVKQTLEETAVEFETFQQKLPVVEGKPSIANWTIQIRFYTREQCYKLIELLSKEPVVYPFNFDCIFNGEFEEYWLTINDMQWATNLTKLGQLLEQCDYGSFQTKESN